MWSCSSHRSLRTSPAAWCPEGGPAGHQRGVSDSQSADSRSYRPVRQDNDVGRGCLEVEERQLEGLVAFVEQPPAAAEHDWVNHQPVLVDQAVVHQGLREIAAPDDLQIPSGLLPELLRRLDDVAVE